MDSVLPVHCTRTGTRVRVPDYGYIPTRVRTRVACDSSTGMEYGTKWNQMRNSMELLLQRTCVNTYTGTGIAILQHATGYRYSILQLHVM